MLEITSQGGPIWLRITGSAEAKELLLSSIDLLQSETAVQAVAALAASGAKISIDLLQSEIDLHDSAK